MTDKIPTLFEARQQLANAALIWWQGKRPLGWSLTRHLEQPDINCTNERERRLAGRAAAYVEANLRHGKG